MAPAPRGATPVVAAVAVLTAAAGMPAAPELPGLEPARRQRHVRARPGAPEPLAHRRRLGRLALGPERLLQPEQRPAVLREPPQVLAIDGLGLGVLARLE